MATIIIKNSANPASTPSSLVQGEFAINVANGRLFYGSGSSNTVKEFASVTNLISTGSISASVDVGSTLFLVNSGSYNILTVGSNGQTTISSSASDIFLIKNSANNAVFTVKDTGVLQVTSSIITPTAVEGGFFYSSSNEFFLGFQ